MELVDSLRRFFPYASSLLDALRNSYSRQLDMTFSQVNVFFLFLPSRLRTRRDLTARRWKVFLDVIHNGLPRCAYPSCVFSHLAFSSRPSGHLP